MNMELQTGDIIKTTCHKIPLCYHLAIVYVENGTVYVFNNAPSVQNKYGGNIVFQSLDEFIGTGVDERKMLDVYSSPLNESQILEYTNKNKKRKWDDIVFNCESYVNEMFKNGEESTQLGRVLEAFIVVSLIYTNK